MVWEHCTPTYLVKSIQKSYKCTHIVLVLPVNFPFHTEACRLSLGLRRFQLATQSGYCNQAYYYQLVHELSGSPRNVH
jgi:hypothetical protein